MAAQYIIDDNEIECSRIQRYQIQEKNKKNSQMTYLKLKEAKQQAQLEPTTRQSRR